MTTDDFINEATGNFIFTVGKVSSGKSTLQNALIFRLWKHPNINFEYDHVRGDHRQEQDLNKWIMQLAAGNLPDRTQRGILKEFNVIVEPINAPKLYLNFLEISGEDIVSIVPGDSDDEPPPKLNDKLDRYLQLDSINKRFIFVSDSEENSLARGGKGGLSEDILFNKLLSHLLSSEGIGLERLNILLVAAKWDAVAAEYRSTRRYFMRHFPQTVAMINGNDRISAVYVPFSIGDVRDEEEPSEGRSGKMRQRIVSLESIHVDRLIQWIYTTYQGRSLKGFPQVQRTGWDRAKLRLSRWLRG